MEEPISLFESQENRKDKMFYYPFNAYSSLFYLITAIPFFKLFPKINLFDLIGLLILVSLAFFSLLWWGVRNKKIQIVDIVLYSSLMIYVGFYYLYKKSDIDEIILTNIFLFLQIIIFLITLIKKNYIKIINCLSILFSIVIFIKYFESYIELLGIKLITFSLILKICDTSKVIDFNKTILISGTGWFHIISAYGIYLIFNELNNSI